jgi:hypothetical protein
MNPSTALLIIAGVITLFVFIASLPEKKHPIYDSEWYHKASEKFGEDYYYPPSSCRSIMQSNGVIIRERQHYKPVRHSNYSPTFTKLERWFKSSCIMEDGRERHLELNFSQGI